MGLAIKQQPKIYLKESVSGSHHMGPWKVCQIAKIDMTCASRNQIEGVGPVKWSFCSLVFAFPER